MTIFVGKILIGDEVIINGAEIRIETVQRVGGICEWHGWFTVPEEVSLDPKQSTYNVELRNGRKGRIRVTNFNLGGVEFQGTGELR